MRQRLNDALRNLRVQLLAEQNVWVELAELPEQHWPAHRPSSRLARRLPEVVRAEAEGERRLGSAGLLPRALGHISGSHLRQQPTKFLETFKIVL